MNTQNKSTKKSSKRSEYRGITKLYRVLNDNFLTGAQFDLMYRVSQPDAPPSTFMDEMLPYIDNLIVTGWVEEDGITLTDKAKSMFKQVDDLFKKNKEKAPPIEIPNERLIAFNEVFPDIKLGSGKRARCNIKEVDVAFQWFFKNYDLYDWDTIIKAASLYVMEQERENFQFTRRAKYFIRKQMLDKSFESDLAEYCERVRAGDLGDIIDNHFKEKVV